jgi:cell division protein FtsL
MRYDKDMSPEQFPTTTSTPQQVSNLIPQQTVDMFTTIFVVSTIISIVVLLLFITVYLVMAMRKWKVQSAVFMMQKDIHEIKTHLLSTPAHPDRDHSHEL